MTKHYKYGGSTAERTRACPVWARLSEGKPNSSSAAAQRGTLMHSAMERLLSEPSTAVTAENFPDIAVADLPLLARSAHVVSHWLDAREVGTVLLEQQLEHTPLIGGSADLLATSSTHNIVLDHKFGRIPVTSYAQHLFYAGLATLCKPEFDNDRPWLLATYQPYVVEAVTYEEFPNATVRSTFKSAERAIAMAEAVSSDKLATHAMTGDHCRYCPAKAQCPAWTTLARKACEAQAQEGLTFEQALAYAAQLKPWIAEVERAALEHAQQGAYIKGYKLVQKRGMRQWRDDAVAEQHLVEAFGEDAYVKKLITPAQAAKYQLTTRAIKDQVLTHAVMRSGGLTLVSDSDKREAVTHASEALKKALITV